jgi:phosphate transport system substrate-binding protein
MSAKRFVQILIMFVVSLSACGIVTPTIESTSTAIERPQPTSTAETVDISTIKADSYPRIDGSTSSYPMQVMIACRILGVDCAWTEGDFFDTTRRIAPVNPLDGSVEVEAIYNLAHSGTHDAYINLIEKNADLILVAREPSEDEWDAARRKRVKLDVQPVALDAFVFLVHVDNPVESLSLDQIRAIYTGEITNWAEVGGLDAEIHTYQRNPNSGSQELMEKLVMNGEVMLDSPDMILMSMMGPFSAIREDPLGIGYSVFFYAKNIFPDENVRMLSVLGIEPTSESIKGHTYPLSTDVYAVLREDITIGHQARLLRDWLLTVKGQEAIVASGYVGLTD